MKNSKKWYKMKLATLPTYSAVVAYFAQHRHAASSPKVETERNFCHAHGERTVPGMPDAKIALGKNGFWNGKKHARGQDAKLALSRDKSSFRTAAVIWNSPPPS